MRKQLTVVLARLALGALGLFDRRDLTMILGLVLLGAGLGQLASWLTLAAPGAVLILVALGLSLTRKEPA